MVELPLEIILHIIGVSVPLSSFDNRDRADFLLPLCLAHRSIRHYARRLLFRHPVLKNEKSFEAFAEVLGENIELGRWVKSLRVGDTDEEKSGMMTVDAARVLVHCKELEELWLASMNRVYVRDLSLAPSACRLSFPFTTTEALDNAELHSLYCDDVGLWLDAPDETPFSLPSLVNLGLISVDIYQETDERHLFSPAVLPSLRKLSLDMVLFDTAEYSPRVESIAGQLEHLACDLHDERSLRALLKACDRLVAFSYGGGSAITSDPLDFGVPLRFFRLDYALGRTDNFKRSTRDIEAAQRAGLVGKDSVVNLAWVRRAADLLRVWVRRQGLLSALECGNEAGVSAEDERSFNDAFWDFSRGVDRRMEGERSKVTGVRRATAT